MRRIGMAVLGLGLMSSPLLGQRYGLREVHDGNRGAFGVNFIVGEPLGAFRRSGDAAAGLSVFGVTSGGALALRLDAGWMVYDARYQGYGVSTLSQIGTIDAGPQLTIGQGPLRFYGFATVGGSMFWNTASYQGCGCYGSNWFLNGHFTTNTSAGGGLLVGLSSGRTPVAIDIGGRYVRHDKVKYVPAGGLTQNPDGSFTAQTVESPVDMRVLQVGVSIGIR
ncbi:MAG TPA: hypothetical protein VKQ05_12325 [Gemmatimonadales bacterium]|nr:hypothetical protein [Gemmatimonadales bacterium]